MSRSGSDPPAVHPALRSAGVRRGCVGVVPEGAQAARGLAEWQRITAADRRPYDWRWRADRLASLLRVRRSLQVHADRELLITRPTHALIAAETGLGTKTIQRRIDDMHLLGWLVTTEVGTTERIRAGRLRGAKDPHAGNRAQEYRLTVPTTVTDGAGEGDPPVSKTRVHDQDHDRHDQRERTNCPPFPSSVRSEGIHGSSRRKARGPGNARARDQRCVGGSARPHAAGKTPPRRRSTRRPAWQARLGEVTAVWQMLPRELTGLLADHEADRLAAAIAAELVHRSVAELGDRISSNWEFWRYKLAAGLVDRPVAVAHRIVRRGFDCPDVRCEDGWQLDNDRPCAACQDQAQRVLADRYAAHTPPHTAERRRIRRHQPAGYDQPVCGAASAPHLVLPPPTLNPDAAHRGASLARLLLGVRDPAEREKIINETGPG